VNAANVVPLHRCGACGGPGAPLDLQCDGEVTAVTVCDACHASIEADLRRVRPVFDTMLAIGVPNDIANHVMTYLLDRWPSPLSAACAED
jgi:hypothetical protein